ncbi:LuxR family transcriptional regulator [Marinovum sp. 2_MG-2023]|uniref:helix-turn-helix transcriptional regulator n=1 Tax=Roseobacteraceae TaxID=2854170 RepID=UPI001FD21716|nr:MULTISPECIES: LuxR family transcriptional regulator [Roseobacteraceae]MCJ7872053.1 LuxR family transcriptional regulator [Phaeobacter sp. J2-8]MDO6731663.1 LuxR family transcriptional regulator [Marinovum sp. 2_MG-2023]MDO6778211.1 LuxR family transcriptional regulator [Marinovum sp. 1_MG-2023]
MTKSRNKYLLDLTNSPTIEALWDMHSRKMAEYGFDRLLYGFTYYRTEKSLGDPNDFLMLTNHDPSYTDEFLGNELYKNAPMTRWAMDHEGVASWTMVGDLARQGALTDPEMAVVQFNQKMGVTVGYTISFKAVSVRSKGAIALTARNGMSQSDADEVWAEHGDDIVTMNNVAHLKILTLPFTVAGKPLTPRQREALEWVGDGKTTQDIALLMGLTAATVEKHLRLAREALNVETTAQAVLKAAFQNQMFVLDL